MIVVLMGVSGVGKTTILASCSPLARDGSSKTPTTITQRKIGGKWLPESH